MGLSSGYGERLLSSVLPNLRSGFQSEMYLTTRSIHSLRGMLVKRLSISKETLNFPHIVTMHGKFGFSSSQVGRLSSCMFTESHKHGIECSCSQWIVYQANEMPLGQSSRGLYRSLSVSSSGCQKGIWRQRGWVVKSAGIVIRRSWVQRLYPATRAICFLVVPSSNPRSCFVNSQMACLLPVGIFNCVMCIRNICFLCFSGMPVN